MTRSRVLVGAITAVLVLGGAGAWWLLRTEEDRVRAVIQEGAAAARARDVVRMDAILAPDFTTSRGLPRAGALEALRYAFQQRYREIDVELGPDPLPVKLEQQETRAVVLLDVRAVGRTAPGAPAEDVLALAQTGNRWVVRLTLREDHWLVVGLDTGVR
ncbi:MAG: hypothetical protein HY904_02180 [Deltaproteobacteria bacterium]|nr:hypothetical protein [Deltaproteobacteria bacterium]